GLLQCGRGRRCLRERLVGAQLSAPETLALLRVFLCAAEQRAADRFHAHPPFWICIDGRTIALQPERGRGGDLRCRGRGSLAVEVDDVAAAPPRPRRMCRGHGGAAATSSTSTA